MSIREAINFVKGKANPDVWMSNRLATLRGQLIAIRIESKTPERITERSRPILQEIALWERIHHA